MQHSYVFPTAQAQQAYQGTYPIWRAPLPPQADPRLATLAEQRFNPAATHGFYAVVPWQFPKPVPLYSGYPPYLSRGEFYAQFRPPCHPYWQQKGTHQIHTLGSVWGYLIPLATFALTKAGEHALDYIIDELRSDGTDIQSTLRSYIDNIEATARNRDAEKAVHDAIYRHGPVDPKLTRLLEEDGRTEANIIAARDALEGITSEIIGFQSSTTLREDLVVRSHHDFLMLAPLLHAVYKIELRRMGNKSATLNNMMSFLNKAISHLGKCHETWPTWARGRFTGAMLKKERVARDVWTYWITYYFNGEPRATNRHDLKSQAWDEYRKKVDKFEKDMLSSFCHGSEELASEFQTSLERIQMIREEHNSVLKRDPSFYELHYYELWDGKDVDQVYKDLINSLEYRKKSPEEAPDVIAPGQKIYVGRDQRVYSDYDKYYLRLHPSSRGLDLRRVSGSFQIWDAGEGGTYATMNATGNFLLMDHNDRLIWSTGTEGRIQNSGAYAQVTHDGRLIVKQDTPEGSRILFEAFYDFERGRQRSWRVFPAL